MNYGNYIAEYLGAGLIFTSSLMIFAMEMMGVDVASITLNSKSQLTSLSTVQGSILFLSMVLFSYPTGYLLFTTLLRTPKILGIDILGREGIYTQETSILRKRPFSDFILKIETESGGGYAAINKYEREFSIIRLYLIVNKRDQFSMITSFWTHQSKIFGTLLASFGLSGLMFLILSSYSKFFGHHSMVKDISGQLSFCALALALISSYAYRRSLRAEIKNIVSITMSIWHQDNNIIDYEYIFAYGSNMLLSRLKARTPSAQKIECAEASFLRLTINKIGRDGSAKANIENSNDPKDKVFGVVYRIDKSEIHLLDSEEPNYDRRRIDLKTSSGQVMMAQAYFARPEATSKNLMPKDWYKKIIIDGAKENELPEPYINTLKNISSEP